MAKKKNKQEIVQENKPEEQKGLTLGYSGNVVVTLKHGNKVISKKEYQNNGTKRLFKFLCNCLIGNSNENNCPQKVKLFNITSDTVTETAEFNSTNFSAVSPYVYFNLRQLSNSDGTQCKIHFIIPTTMLPSDANKIYAVALYDGASTVDFSDHDAIYKFVNTTTGAWDPIELSNRNNYNIIIEWFLNVENK